MPTRLIEDALEIGGLTPEAYLAAERVSSIRHEYLAGSVYAMSGASRDHGRITGNIARILGNMLAGGRCEPFSTEIRLMIPWPGSRIDYYPDVVVDCSGGSEDCIEIPTVIFEVLSDSTRRTDRGEKLVNYQSIPSLRVYVLAAQDQPALTVYRRTTGGWSIEHITSLDGALDLAEIGCSLPLREIYARVSWTVRKAE